MKFIHIILLSILFIWVIRISGFDLADSEKFFVQTFDSIKRYPVIDNPTISNDLLNSWDSLLRAGAKVKESNLATLKQNIADYQLKKGIFETNRAIYIKYLVRNDISMLRFSDHREALDFTDPHLILP